VGWLSEPLAGVGADFFGRRGRAKKETSRKEKIMLSDNTKSTAVKAGRSALFQSGRNATAERGLSASRGLPLDARASSQAPNLSVPADRIGTIVTLFLGIALVAGGALTVAQIWTNLAMIR
jgi:hypothetical protein